ncbi:hypothetical protein TI04_00040 [Achromatium sp. WMS2]|nr:hypothetical protein TI04_00040 [Achromatium sp. WMS2]
MEDKQIMLKQAGLRSTLPRTLILEILERNPQRHLSAEGLYQLLLERGHSIGIATIYRVLAQFEQAGLVIKHQFESNTSFFELSTHSHHDHIVCVNCGRIIEFVNNDIERLQREVASKQGLELTGHTLYIFGTCKTPETCPYRHELNSIFHTKPAT